MNSFSVAKNTLALLIPEVYQAIIEDYKEETIRRCPTTPDDWRLIANETGGMFHMHAEPLTANT